MGNVSVIGTGYLGATHAAAMAEAGHTVIGIDVDAARVDALNRGEPPFFEPGLADLVKKHVATGALSFSQDVTATAECDAHFLCVGTPQQAGSDAADLTHVHAAVAALAPVLTKPTLVIGKSTVPVGTAQELASTLARTAPAGDAVHLAWNPEFLREGHAIEDTLSPDRIVVGVMHASDERKLRDLYAAPIAAGTPFLSTDFATAELVKVAANAFLATKVSFINAMAEVCEVTGADVTHLAEAIGHDDRIGPKFLRAGIGFGGGCLPKDIRAFGARAGELGVGPSLAFLREIDEINTRRRHHTVEIAREMLSRSILGARIAVLGVAFKPDSDDIRDSPALNIAAALHLQGAQVRVYDPRANANASRAFPTLNYAPDAESALEGAHLVLLLTEWAEFLDLDPVLVAKMVESPVILDGRNALDAKLWRTAGWEYRGLGRR
ncbi:MAG: UDP-glucose/GDP-mannose dehydrogenase family protein [Candidatus Nanopelagicales bacterium]|nr:UDP-glucose/GDP-mannose dehydrogenase family protein [Candidatus Nanopelagicales bacterium]MDZ4250754.1 UDP-glucose/GDP-mannose dehydrogenase family protein [Candidatus Nanopelagicales bacterium]